MKWTKEPTKPGWYWCYSPRGSEVIEIESMEEVLIAWFPGNDDYFYVSQLPSIDYQWLGPLPVPEKPEEL